MFSIITQVTTQAKQRYMNMLETGESFKILNFTVGSGGHDPNDPRQVLTPNSNLIKLPNQNNNFSPKGFETISSTIVDPNLYQVVAKLDYNEGLGELSNIGIWAKIIFDGTTEIDGPVFLFSVGNFPLQIKTTNQIKQFICRFRF